MLGLLGVKFKFIILSLMQGLCQRCKDGENTDSQVLGGSWHLQTFEVRVFKTAGKTACGTRHLESLALGKLRQEAFCELRGNLGYMLSSILKANSNWEESLVAKVLFAQPRGPAFDSQNPH